MTVAKAKKITKRQTAFNEGTAAQLRGEPEKFCPHFDDYLASWWRKGWDHCDRYWGAAVRGRWPVVPLPELRGGVA